MRRCSFVINEVPLDFDAINKVDSLLWDWTTFAGESLEELTVEELALLHRLAEIIARGDTSFRPMRDFFRSEPALRR
jgi:hypothetical protein